MDIDIKITYYYRLSKNNEEAAEKAERAGNKLAASKLYREAAKALCNMALLESGETQEYRYNRAEALKQRAYALMNAADEPVSVENAPRNSPANAVKAQTSDSDESNPWKSEGIPSVTFDDVVGMEDVKELIIETVIDQIKDPELYEQYGLRGGTGVLLFGLPGTGKTTIARAIAHEINAPLYTAKLSDVLTKWVGESEKKIKQLFEKARSTPTAMIFFDDVDALGAERTDDNNHNNKIIVELINQMDGFQKNTNTILLLAATNKPWMIDSALMRPGRFEHHIYVPLANHEARIVMIQKNLGNVSVAEDLDMDRVSDLLAGYNGADIVSVVKSAKGKALKRTKGFKLLGEEKKSPVCFEDFAFAAAQHKSSVDPDDVVRLREYAAKRGIILPEEL